MDAFSPLIPAAGPVDPLDPAPAGLGVAVLGQLALIAVDDAPLGLVLQHLAGIAQRAIPGVVAVSITVVRDRAASSAGLTGAVAAALDERQYEAGFGPCLHAAATCGEVVVDDTASSAAYPGFAALAARHGVGSVVAIALAVGGVASAALAVYRAEPASADRAAMAATIAAARLFAVYAAVAVSNAAAMDAQRSTCAQLSDAMASRAGIEQAKGVLMAQRGISAQAAFAALAAISQESNVKLAQVAAQVLANAAGEGRQHP